MFEYFVPRFGSPGAVWRSPKYLVHPLGDMNVSRKFNGNPSDGYLDISATKPVSTWLRCSGFSWCVWIPGVDPFSFPDNMSVCRVMSWMHWCVYLCGICSCCCSAMRLCPAHYTHTHTHTLPAHTEASGCPAGNTLTRSWHLKCRLNCFVWGKTSHLH